MPLPFLFDILENGVPAWMWNNARTITYTIATVSILVLTKIYTSGATNPAERDMHGKVILMTGGTSGVGARVAHNLAARGAQLVLLTKTAASDPFLADFIQDLRDRHNNQLIYTEQVDLSSLHSIRKFATKWIDNAPPRRLDMIVLCAATLTPSGSPRKETEEGVEETWMVNFLSNFHLLGILSPAIRAQPFDRDVRVIVSTCSAYIGSPSLKTTLDEKNWSPSTAYARSKLALNVFGQAFQKHLDSYKRPDGFPMNARVIFVDPGLSRTPGTMRWLTRGSLLGLAFYLASYIVSWFLLKSPERGAQPFLYAAMEASLGRGDGGKLIKECREVDFARPEVKDEDVAKKLWEESDALIERLEKTQAKKRAGEKAEKEKSSRRREEKEKMADIESLMGAIRKGKDREREKDKDKDKQKEKDKKKREKEKEKEREKRRSKDKDSDKEKSRSKDKDSDKEKSRSKDKDSDKDRSDDNRSIRSVRSTRSSKRRSRRSDS
jgi:NAD(P)-dependent dehydrogenase (short-subunit alcohol dehydrogenase family)